MSELSAQCARDAAADDDRAVRRAFHLFKLSAPAIRALADPDLDESAFELALERDGSEAAIRLIAGERASFEVAEPAVAGGFASTIAFDGGEAVRGEGNSRALAMVAAWANYFRKAR